MKMTKIRYCPNIPQSLKKTVLQLCGIKKYKMSTTTFSPSVTTSYSKRFSISTAFAGFTNWCKAQDFYRLFWLGIILGVHGCVLSPLTIAIIMYTGINMFMLLFACLAMAMCLIVNLAALPIRITIPVFIISVIIDVAIIIACVLPV